MSKMNLQLFAEGGSGTGAQGAGSTAEGNSGVSTPATGENEGTAEVTSAVEGEDTDPEAEFEALIGDKYKEQFNKRVTDIVQKRLKNTKAAEEQVTKLQPLIDTLAAKYNVDASNIDSLIQKVADDSSFYEQEALERGIPVDVVKEMKNLQMQRDALDRTVKQVQFENARRAEFDRLTREGNELKKIYPSFNLQGEMQNPAFVRLVQSNVPVKQAYEVVHINEIQAAVIPAAVNKATQKVANSVKANSKRPTENGLGDTISGSASATHKSVSEMTKAERAELMKRALSGEKITL